MNCEEKLEQSKINTCYKCSNFDENKSSRSDDPILILTKADEIEEHKIDFNKYQYIGCDNPLFLKVYNRVKPLLSGQTNLRDFQGDS